MEGDNRTKKRIVGDFGEDLACRFLKNNGYKIIERNYLQKWGEIDIIAIAPDKTLVFFEVKTINKVNSVDFSPEEQVTFSKLKRLKKTAIVYANKNNNLINEERGWQIDLLAIDLNNNLCDYTVRHYPNI